MRVQKNKKLTLTIVIPAFNEESYLKNCLDSVAAQEILADEVIVVDNNSTDSTRAITDSYNFVTYITEKRQGVFYAATKGFATAKSDIIARIDADTILPANWVETVKNSFTPNIQAVTGPVYYYDMPLSRTNHWFDHALRLLTYKYAKRAPFLYGSNMAIRKLVWQSVRGSLCTHRTLHEDIDLAVHIFEKGHKILYSRQFLSGASGRRYNDSPRDFWGYVVMYKNNLSTHHLPLWPVYPAIFMWSMGYVLVHPVRSFWYAFYRNSGREYPWSAAARKNPMSS